MGSLRPTSAMVVRPQTHKSRNSGGPNDRISPRTTGNMAIRTSTPNVEPSAEAAAAQPIAVPASPLRAIGYPSSIVAALGAVPGTLNRIAVIEPMNVAPPTNAP